MLNAYIVKSRTRSVYHFIRFGGKMSTNAIYGVVIAVLILLSERHVKARCNLPDGGIAAGFFQH